MQCTHCGNLNPADRSHCYRCNRVLTHASDPPPVPRIAEGTRVHDRFRVVRLLGEGGMGQVFEAFDERLERTIALKVLSVALLGSHKAKERFEREAKVIARVRHLNVIEVYDFFEFETNLILGLEFVSGGTLAERIGKGLEVSEALRIGRGVLAGLEALHAQGLVHRDIKPSNILMTSAGQPKIADLGIAHDAGARSMTRTGAKLGTPEYMSPEQIRGAQVDARTDLYSFGILLFEALTGEVPFKGPSEFDVQEMQIRDPVDASKVRGRMPEAVVRAVLRALEKDPAARFASAAEMLSVLVPEAPSSTANVAPAATGGRPGDLPGLCELLSAAAQDNLLADAPRCRERLVAAHPSARKEVRALVVAVEEGITKDLAKQGPQVLDASSALLADSGIEPELAKWAVGAWAKAIDAWQRASETPAGTLARLVREHGANVGQDPAFLRALWERERPKDRREFYALRMAIDEGVVGALSAAGTRDEHQVVACIRHVDAMGLKQELARWAVEAWATALGLAGEKSTSQATVEAVLVSNPIPEASQNRSAGQPSVAESTADTAPVPRGAQAGASWTNPKDGSVLLRVPAGAYSCGDDSGAEDEKPLHRVELSGFWVARSPVTREQYRRFSRQAGIQVPSSWTKSDGDLPATEISWDEATGYAEWAGLVLPTEAQWEAAARGPKALAYPWGSTFDLGFCANNSNSSSPKPVGSFPSGTGPFGTLDQVGNVWEWCLDSYIENAYRHRQGVARLGVDPVVRSANLPKVIRGGAWSSSRAEDLRPARRGRALRTTRSADLGFRCALIVP